jgi:hypothetical protein
MINKNISDKESEVWVDEEGFLNLKLSDTHEADLDEVKRCFGVYTQLGFGPNNKALQIIYSPEHLPVNHEARQYASEEGRNFFIASAVISSSLPVKLMVNFFIKFYKPPVPFKMFSTEEEARKWLRTFKNP